MFKSSNNECKLIVTMIDIDGWYKWRWSLFIDLLLNIDNHYINFILNNSSDHRFKMPRILTLKRSTKLISRKRSRSFRFVIIIILVNDRLCWYIRCWIAAYFYCHLFFILKARVFSKLLALVLCMKCLSSVWCLAHII